MKALILLSLLVLVSCQGVDPKVSSSDAGASCSGRINSSWVDDGGATLDLTFLDLDAPVTYQFMTNSGLYTCEATAIVSGDECSGTIAITGGRQIAGPGITSQCRVDGVYNYSIKGGTLTYGRQGSSIHSYH